jgi:hypothetical protein
LFPEPKMNPETFRVATFAREVMRFETVWRLATFRVVTLAVVETYIFPWT